MSTPEPTANQVQPTFQQLFDHSAVATFAINPDHKVLYWNKPCEVLTGVSADDILGTADHWKGFYSEKRPCLSDIVLSGNYEKLPKLYSKYNRAVLIPNGWHAEGWFDNLGGQRRYVIFDAAPIYGHEGDLIAVTENLMDITQEKIVDLEREDLLTRLQSAVSEMKDLHGAIQICAWCKNIHQPDDSWGKLDDYLSRHTDMQFSHGICPTCADREYADLNLN